MLTEEEIKRLDEILSGKRTRTPEQVVAQADLNGLANILRHLPVGAPIHIQRHDASTWSVICGQSWICRSPEQAAQCVSVGVHMQLENQEN